MLVLVWNSEASSVWSSVMNRTVEVAMSWIMIEWNQCSKYTIYKNILFKYEGSCTYETVTNWPDIYLAPTDVEMRKCLKAQTLEGPQGGSESRFYAGFLRKARPEIAWNSWSRQVYPIMLDARLIYPAIMQFLNAFSVFTLWNMYNNAITLPSLGGPFSGQVFESYMSI